MSKRWRPGTLAILLSPLGIVVVSATRLLLISNYDPTTATAIASSGGYVNTLLGSVIPLVSVTLPYLVLVLLAFKRFLLAGLTAAAALIVSPAKVTFPRLAFASTNRAVKADLHRFTIDHPQQTLLTGAILLAAAFITAWQWDRDVKNDVIDEVNKIKGLRRPVSRWGPSLPRPATGGDELPPSPNPDIEAIATKYRVSLLAVQQWANRRVWFRPGTLFAVIILWLGSLVYVSYFYPFPRSIAYYEATLHQPWLPAERLTLRSGNQVVGYPLAIDGSWMVILGSRTRTVQYILADEVTTRSVCQPTTQIVLLAASAPLFPLFRYEPPHVPFCQGPVTSAGELPVSKWTTSAAKTTSRDFEPIPSLGRVETCDSGQVIATLSAELRFNPAGFRLRLDNSITMKPGRVRFVPSGLHDSFSFTFIQDLRTTVDHNHHALRVEWRSPTGRTTTLERATLNVRCG
jgi:hypothetical protein